MRVTSQVFPSRAVFISQGQAFRESTSVSHQLPAPATAGGGCTGPVKGLWAGHQPHLFYLVSYLRGRNVLLGFGDYQDFCFVHCPTALHCRKTSWWFSGALCPPSDIQQSLSNDSLMISLVSLFSTMQIIAVVTPNSNSFLLTTPVLVRAGYVL